MLITIKQDYFMIEKSQTKREIVDYLIQEFKKIGYLGKKLVKTSVYITV